MLGVLSKSQGIAHKRKLVAQQRQLAFFFNKITLKSAE